MAGTVVTTETNLYALKKIGFAFTSATTGAADATTTQRYTGHIEVVQIVPGGTTPTDQFDVTLVNGDGVDVLYGDGANCSNTDTTVIMPDTPIVADTLTLGVTAAGSGKNGTVIVYIGGD
jgi:hypothetical protein